MKNALILSALLIMGLASCVQPYSDKTIKFTLDVSEIQDSIKTVGVRGKDKPLSWREDVEMKAIYPDSLYEASVTIATGYLFTEVKFVVNGEFELQDKDNRRVNFDKTNTETIYKAVYNNP